MDNFYNPGYYPPPDAEFLQIRADEKKALRHNACVLGILLILYNVFLNVAVYVYYYVFYFAVTGSISFDYHQVMLYLQENIDRFSITEFEMFGNAFITMFSLVLILAVAKLCFKIGPASLMKPDPKAIKLGIIAFPFSMLLNYIFTIMTNILSSFLESMGYVIPEAEFSLDKPTFAAGFAMFCYLVVLGPIIEEVVYRGFILKLLAPYGKTTAVFFSAFIFGFMHGNLPQFVSAFATGMVYASVAVYTGSIIPTMIMHIFNNGLNYIAICGSDYDIPKLTTLFSVLFVIIILLGIMEIFLYRKIIKRRPAETGHLTAKECVTAIVLNIPMIIYFAYLIYDFADKIVQANT